MTRYFVVGDVHGCLDELNDLLEHAGLAAHDRVVFVGDLVGKGPASLRVLDRVRELGAQSVLGNHDDALLRQHADFVSGRDVEVNEVSAHMLLHIRADQIAWLAQRPLYLPIAQHNLVVLHAGVLPNVRLADQAREHLLTLRTLRADGTGSKRLSDGQLWATAWSGPEHIVFGHDAMTGLQRQAFATGLDTGAVYGGRLSGCFVPSFEIVSVPARRAYVDPGKKLQKRIIRAA